MIGLEGTLKPTQPHSLLWVGCPPPDEAAQSPSDLPCAPPWLGFYETLHEQKSGREIKR